VESYYEGMAKPGTSIRHATAAEAHDLARLAAALFPLGCPANTTQDDLAAYINRELFPGRLRSLLEDERTIALVVEISGQLVGYALVAHRVPPSQIPSSIDCELRKFYIDASLHGSGIANMLMKEVVAAAATRCHGSLWLSVFSENDRAVSFYRRCGFRVVGSQEFLVGSDRQKDFLMLREGTPSAKENE
jgi:ribosomal protein S18 acetylase RimI-like enzyme